MSNDSIGQYQSHLILMPVMNNCFVLHANCVLVKGASRSTICDLQYGRIHLIPNDLHDILISGKGVTIESVYDLYGEANKDAISEYYEFLIDNDLGFYCPQESISCFPEINYVYDTPYLITNSIIDIDAYNHNFPNLFSQLEYLGCVSLQLRFFSAKNYDYIFEVMKQLEFRRFKSIELYICYSDWTSSEIIIEMCSRFVNIVSVIVHSSPYKETIVTTNGLLKQSGYIMDSIIDEMHCGFISPTNFTTNIEAYSESVNYNSCLNKKVSIDRYGNICNCPAMKLSYGHCSQVSIIDVIASDEFTSFWRITKDQVSICRDCEFRHVCTDCRAITQADSGDLAKPLRCNYDPYTATWG